jgi:internalin A
MAVSPRYPPETGGFSPPPTAERRIAEARREGAEVLDLGDLGLEELPASLGDLPALRKLYLGAYGPTEAGHLRWHDNYKRAKFTDLAPLANLHGLQSLDFSHTDVTDLAPLSNLQALQNLYLSSTGVTDLAPLANLQGLQQLSLSSTGVTDLAPLANLQGLQTLFLFNCRPLPETFRALADHPRLASLWADEVAGIPREVLSHNQDNCLPRLRAYLSELKLGAEAENEVKVILLGNGRVGKTQLCRRFRDEPFNEPIESTHGVQIWRKPFRLQKDEEQVFQVNWWDFGGQDIYHGTHALFLRSRAVFLLLWTPALENRDEYTENGLTLRN